MRRYVIYSANEDALTGAGYWNESKRWTEISQATIYHSKSISRLPRSVGFDARFKDCGNEIKLIRYSVTLSQGVTMMKNTLSMMSSTEFEASERAIKAYPGSQVIKIQKLNTVLVLTN